TMRRLRTLARVACLTCATLLLPVNGAALADEGHISIDVRDADIIDVLRMLATEANVSILTDATVKHEKVTLCLRSVSFAQALNVISRAYGLHISHERDVITVSSGSSVTTAIRLRYARSSDVIRQLRGLLPEKNYSADEKSNIILVTGDGTALEEARSVISAIDTPTPQVMFEVRVADIIGNNDVS